MTWIFALIALMLVVAIHEFGHLVFAKLAKIKVHQFAIGFGPKIWGFKYGETVYNLRAIPLGGYVLPDEDQLEKSSKMTKAKVISGGVIFNIISAIIVMTIALCMGTTQLKTTINVVEKTPAYEVLEDGDEIVQVNGVAVSTWNEIAEEINKANGKSVEVTYIRDSVRKTSTLKPNLVDSENPLGEKVKKYVIGISPTGETVKTKGLGLPESLLKSTQSSVYMIVLSGVVIYKMIFGEVEAKKNLAGPVTIMTMINGAAKSGLADFLLIMAIISVCIAFMNMLPIPCLDGGHIMFLCVDFLLEKTRGKPMSLNTRNSIQVCFMFALYALFGYVIYLDILRLMGQ